MLYPLPVAVVVMVVGGGWCSVAPYHEEFPKELLVPVVQSKILRHLNWTTPPSDVATPLPVLPSYVTRHFEEERKDSEGQQNIVMPGNKIFACVHSNRRDCSRFQFEVTPSPHGFSSVQVWFRKRQPSSRLLVSVVFSDNETRTQNYDELSSNVTVEDRWVGFTLSESALEELGDRLSCVVEVSGGRVSRTGPDGPFLLARSSPPTSSRERRSARPGCNCRVVDRVLTLNDLSWDKWIIAPHDLNIRACKGYCRPDQGSYNITYGSIMHNLVKSNPGMAADDEFWLPRCVPSKMTDMKMIYVRNNTTEIVETDVSNLVIQECSCMANNCHKNH